MPQLGLGSSLRRVGGIGRTYVKDGLKLYMPYKGTDITKGTQFVGTGSTAFVSGSSQYIDCGNDSSLQIGTGDFSFFAWVKRASTNVDQVIFSYGDSGVGGEVAVYLRFTDAGTTDRLHLRFDDGDTDIAPHSTSVIGDTDWHHVGFTFDRDSATGIKFYIDGAADVSDVPDGSGATDAISHASDGFIIGARESSGSNTNYFNGSMKNVALWNRVLTATEVQNVMYKTYAEVSGRLASGLVSWWSLESTGTPISFSDSHGSNTGTNSGATANNDLYGGDTPVKPRAIDNAPTVQSDAIGSGSASFTASNTDYINFGNVCNLGGSTDFTITAWVKSTEWTDDRLLGKHEDANNRWHLGSQGSDKMLFYSRTTAGIGIYYQGTITLTEDEWVHLAIVSDRSSGTTGYVNGILDDTDTDTDPDLDIDNDGDFHIGQAPNDPTYFDGNICQVGIWSAVLTQAQIQSIMEKTYEKLTASEKTNLVSYWTLDEETSTGGVRGETGGVADSEGSNHGTLV